MTHETTHNVEQLGEAEIINILATPVAAFPVKGILRNTHMVAGCRVVITGCRDADTYADILDRAGCLVARKTMPAEESRVTVDVEWGRDYICVGARNVRSRFTFSDDMLHQSRFTPLYDQVGHRDLYAIASQLARLGYSGIYERAVATVFPKGDGEISSFLVNAKGAVVMDQGATRAAAETRHSTPARELTVYEQHAVLRVLTTY